VNLKKCSKGHYYDSEKYTSCPHCNKQDGAKRSSAGPDSRQPDMVSLLDAVNNASSTMYANENDATVSYYGGSMQSEPVVGWLVCIEGHCLGKAFPLKNGKNFIGRGGNMDVVLEGDNNVSRMKHAIVTYEPQSRTFVAQPGESRELFYVNNQVVLMNVELKDRDMLVVGRTKLMFVPLCGPAFAWEDVQTR
jgi:hypothetical protein